MLRQSVIFIVLTTFISSLLTPIPGARAEGFLGLPEPGVMVSLSPAYEPAIIKGLMVHRANPFQFDFIMDTGQDHLQGQALKQEGEKLITYFMASLAIPEDEVWVNLSPYEKDRTIPGALGQTGMGRDLLAQDYLLKQLTASLIYPEKSLGKEFWQRVYQRVREEYGNAQVPVNTFNKVWIMADKARVFEHDQTAFVVDAHLKVMLEEDYLALQKHSSLTPPPGLPHQGGEIEVQSSQHLGGGINALSSQLIRQIILPELDIEVNRGRNFANLRQIFNSLILAAWYKKRLQQTLLNEVYSNRGDVRGIGLRDQTFRQEIYQQYLKAYKKGVFNFIKEDVGPKGDLVPRKYFSGGVVGKIDFALDKSTADLAASLPDRAMADVNSTLGLIKPEEDTPYSPNRKVRTKNSKKMLDGKYELVSLEVVRDKFELFSVVKSRTTGKLGLKWKDGSLVTNDSYWYGEDEDGKSAKKGRSPDWIYILKPKKDSGWDQTDRIYAGDDDIRRTFPQSVYAAMYKKIDELRNSKKLEIAPYRRKVEDMRRMVVLFPGVLNSETLENYKEVFLPEVDALKGTVGIGDPSYALINEMYTMFSHDWKSIYKGKNQVSMEDFFLAWNSFKDGYSFLNSKTVRNEGMKAVLENPRDVDFIIKFIRRLNKATKEPGTSKDDGLEEEFDVKPVNEHLTNPMADREVFWSEVDRLTALFNNIRNIEERRRNLRADIFAGKAPQKTHPDDMNRDGLIDAISLVAGDIVRLFSKRQGGEPTILVASAQGGILRQKINAVAPQLKMKIVDMEDNLSDANPQNIALEAKMHVINYETGLPIVNERSEAAVSGNINLDTSFKAQALVLTHLFNQYRSPRAISNALSAALKLLDAPNQDIAKAPLVFITLPENTLLRGTRFEQTLLQLGFEPIEQGRDLKFVLTDVAKDALREKFRRQIKEAREIADPLEIGPEIERRVSKVEASVRKPFNYGVYARVGYPVEGTDISRLKMERELVQAQGGQGRVTVRGVLNWGYLRNLSALASLDDGAKKIDPEESTRIYKREDPRLAMVEQVLNALDFFLQYSRGVNLNDALYRQLETPASILKLWDGDEEHPPALYLLDAEKRAIERFGQQFAVPKHVLKSIFSAKRTDFSKAGPLDLMPVHLDEFYARLGEPKAVEYSILDIYHAFEGIGGVDTAMNTEARDNTLGNLKSFITHGLMDQGRIPSEDLIKENIQSSARLRGVYLQIFSRLAGEPLPDFIKKTVNGYVKEKILQAVSKIKNDEDPSRQIPTLGRVADELYESFPYLKALLDKRGSAGIVETNLQLLEEFIKGINGGYKKALGIEDEPVLKPGPTVLISPDVDNTKLTWKAVEVILKRAVADINQEGLMADIDSVSDRLLKSNNLAYASWLNRYTGKKENGDPLLAWIRACKHDMTNDEIYDSLKILVIDQGLRDWETRAAGNKISRVEIGMKYPNFEVSLTSLFMFTDLVPNESLAGLVYSKNGSYHAIGIGRVKGFKKRIARIRYLWDTKQVADLDKDQVEEIIKLASEKAITSKLLRKIKDYIGISYVADNDVNIGSLILSDFFMGLESKKINLGHIRPRNNANLVVINIINFNRKLQGNSQGVDSPLMGPKTEASYRDLKGKFQIEFGNSLIDPRQNLTYSAVAAAIYYFTGQPITPQGLKDWFQSDFMIKYGLDAHTYGIVDDPLVVAPVEPEPALPASPEAVALSPAEIKAAWAQEQGHIREAVKAVKEDSSGLGPDIYNVAAQMLHLNTSPSFKAYREKRILDVMKTIKPDDYRWVITPEEEQGHPDIYAVTTKEHEIQRRVALGQLLVSWIKANEEGIKDEGIYQEFGIFVPSEKELHWDSQFHALSKNKIEVLTKEQLNSDLETNIYEAALTWAFWFFDHLDAKSAMPIKRVRQFPVNGKGKFILDKVFKDRDEFLKEKREIDLLRFLRDTMGVDNIPKDLLNLAVKYFKFYYWVELLPDNIKDPNIGFHESLKEGFDYLRRQGKTTADFKRVFDGLSKAGRPDEMLGDMIPRLKEQQNVKQKKDPFLKRNLALRRLARINYIFHAKAQQLSNLVDGNGKLNETQRIQTSLEDFNARKSINSAASFVCPIYYFKTFETMAQTLSMMGDLVAGDVLKRWFEDNHISPALFNIYDSEKIARWDQLKWVEKDEMLKKAVDHINNEGYQPDIDNVASYLYNNQEDQRFKVWMEHRMVQRILDKNKYKPTDALADWLKESNPNLDVHEVLFRDYGIFVPTREHRSWEERKDPKENITREQLGSPSQGPYDYREFEGRLTALIWFAENIKNGDLEKLIPFAAKTQDSKVSGNDLKEMLMQIKEKTAEIRYFWDRNSYLTARQIDYVYQVTTDLVFSNSVMHLLIDAQGKKYNALKNLTIPSMFLQINDSGTDFIWAKNGIKLRSPEARVLSSISIIVLNRNELSQVINITNETGIRRTIERFKTIASIHTKQIIGGSRLKVFNSDSTPLTYTNVAALVSYFDIVISADGLKSALAKSYVQPGFFGIEDAAMTSPRREGGINLDASRMDLSVSRDGAGVVMDINPAMIARFRRDGIRSLTPRINHITIINNIWSLIGVKAPDGV